MKPVLFYLFNGNVLRALFNIGDQSFDLLGSVHYGAALINTDKLEIDPGLIKAQVGVDIQAGKDLGEVAVLIAFHLTNILPFRWIQTSRIIDHAIVHYRIHDLGQASGDGDGDLARITAQGEKIIRESDIGKNAFT